MSTETPRPGLAEPTTPGWYAYSGGGQTMIFLLRSGGRWSVHFDNGTASDCTWAYIEQALGVWDLVPIGPDLSARLTVRMSDLTDKLRELADEWDRGYLAGACDGALRGAGKSVPSPASNPHRDGATEWGGVSWEHLTGWQFQASIEPSRDAEPPHDGAVGDARKRAAEGHCAHVYTCTYCGHSYGPTPQAEKAAAFEEGKRATWQALGAPFVWASPDNPYGEA